jgi:hypothetical protein
MISGNSVTFILSDFPLDVTVFKNDQTDLSLISNMSTRKSYTIIHANGQPFEDLAYDEEDEQIGLIRVTKSLSKEQLAGIAVCLYLTDLEIDSYMYVEKIDMYDVVAPYLNADRTGPPKKYKYQLSCDGTNEEVIIVNCKSKNFIKGFMWAADIISPANPRGRWAKYTIILL